MSLNIILYLSSFPTNLLTILNRHLYIYVLIFQFWHSTSINVRLSYRFRASLIWMLSSLFYMNVGDNCYFHPFFPNLLLFYVWEGGNVNLCDFLNLIYLKIYSIHTRFRNLLINFYIEYEKKKIFKLYVWSNLMIAEKDKI